MRAVPISMDGSQFQAVSQKLSPMSAMGSDLSAFFSLYFFPSLRVQYLIKGFQIAALFCSGNCKARNGACKEGIRKVNDNNNWFITYYSA